MSDGLGAADRDTLQRLEQSLWRAETRYDPAYMGRLFAEDFFEFGRSGGSHVRAELLFDPLDRREIFAELIDFRVRMLSGTIAQSVYISKVVYPSGTEWANRSSLWDRASGSWQLRFHQGTPTQPHGARA